MELQKAQRTLEVNCTPFLNHVLLSVCKFIMFKVEKQEFSILTRAIIIDFSNFKNIFLYFLNSGFSFYVEKVS